MFDDLGLAADHLAEAALQSPYAAAGAGIDVVDALGAQRLGAAEVVDVVGVAAVDQDVARLEPAGESASVCSTTAAGTIIQATRGCLSFALKSSSEEAPIAPSLTSVFTASGLTSKTTHS